MGMNDVPRCQHVKVNGVQCGSPALRRKRFCYFHDNYRQTQARLMEDESKVQICNFPLLEDANSIQVAVMHVIHLLGSGKMDNKIAGLMLYALQTASANMKRVTFETPKVTDIVIDLDTLELTCINGPQWFERDFAENLEESKQLPRQIPEMSKPNEPSSPVRANLRKKPDPLHGPPGGEDSLAARLLRRMGLPTEYPQNESESRREAIVAPS
jgi:hypothetical protein